MSETGSPPLNKKPRSSLENPQELILTAIQDGNYEKLNLLLKPGVKLNPGCFFIAHAKHGWEMVKILLENDPSGLFARNILGETLLMLNINDIEAVRYLLDHGANASANAFELQGETVLLRALKQAQPNVEILRLLFQHGADLNKLVGFEDPQSDSYFKNALYYAVNTHECYKKEIFQFLIENCGMDPFVKDSKGHNVFFHAVNEFGNILRSVLLFESGYDDRILIDPFGEVMTKLRQERTEALEYILTLPQYQQYQDEHPQTIYLKNWSPVPMFEMPEILLSPEFKQSNLIIPGIIQQRQMGGIRYPTIDRLVDLPVTIYFSPVSLCIDSLMFYSSDVQKYILKFLKSLVENGFRVDEPNSISPLTLVIFQYLKGILKINSEEKTNFKYISSGEKVGKEVKSELVEVTKFLIEKGAHVGQSIVPFPANAPEFETLRQDLCLPDAVYAAFESGCFFCLPLVLPYFAQPPLTLLLLTEPDWTALVNSSFPILCKGGPIPPGSRYLRDLISHLQRMNAELKIDHVYNKFLEMHSSPPSLMHLSRCVIRSSYAERVSQPGESLPKLMRSFEIPEELKDYLEMPAPERLDTLYCDDPIMAQIANEGVQQLELELGEVSEDESDVDSDEEY